MLDQLIDYEADEGDIESQHNAPYELQVTYHYERAENLVSEPRQTILNVGTQVAVREIHDVALNKDCCQHQVDHDQIEEVYRDILLPVLFELLISRHGKE